MGDLRKLAEPFPAEDIEWFIGVTTKDKLKGMAVPFITARAAQDRLDDVVGQTNWNNDYIPWKDEAQLCRISIWDEDKKMWISKTDGSGDTDIESVKGGLSQSFKRCASLWGIGRYLYYLESPWVEIEPQGRSYRIKPNQQIMLPGWALPGGTGKPGVKDPKTPTVKTIGYDAPPPPQQTQQRPPQPQQAQGFPPQGAPAPSGNRQAGKLTPKQVDRALKKAEAAQQTKDMVLLWIEKKYGVHAIEDLSRQQYDELCAALDRSVVR